MTFKLKQILHIWGDKIKGRFTQSTPTGSEPTGILFRLKTTISCTTYRFSTVQQYINNGHFVCR